MGVALRGADLGVAQDLLHLIDRPSPVHQEAGKAVTQIVNAQVSQSRSLSDSVPGVVNACIWLFCLRIGERIGATFDTRHVLDQLDR